MSAWKGLKGLLKHDLAYTRFGWNIELPVQHLAQYEIFRVNTFLIYFNLNRDSGWISNFGRKIARINLCILMYGKLHNSYIWQTAFS